MRWAVLLVGLAGCVPAPELTGNAQGGVVTYHTSRAASDVHGRGANVGFGLAEQHCRGHGRTAVVRMVDDIGGSLVFICTAP
jgi:hypothetical protein